MVPDYATPIPSEVTARLLQDNTELRATVAELEEENATLRATMLQVEARVDVMTDRINCLLAFVQS